MNIVTEPQQRCRECGGENPTLIRFQMGGLFCLACIELARDVLTGRSQPRADLDRLILEMKSLCAERAKVWRAMPPPKIGLSEPAGSMELRDGLRDVLMAADVDDMGGCPLCCQ